MDLNIKRESSLSIHIQLKEQIKGLILNGLLEPKTQLPTVRQLGEFLRINKNTVSKVYKELEKERYVYSIKGKGTFVLENAKSQKVKDFMTEVEKVLKKGLESKLDMEEIWGIVYSKSQQYSMIAENRENRNIAFIECNTASINEFKSLVKKKIENINVKGVLINDIMEDKKQAINNIVSSGLVIVPFIHYEEVKQKLVKLKKEIMVIGTNQSIKILAYNRKLKNKTVGFISMAKDDEPAIYRQFKVIKMKDVKYYGGYSEKGRSDLKNFIEKVDVLVVCSSVKSEIKDMILDENYIIFESKYDINDLDDLEKIYNEN